MLIDESHPSIIGRTVPKMRTDILYKTPSIHRKSGKYISKTTWVPPGFIYCRCDIYLTWFNHSGWYYWIELTTHADIYTKNRIELVNRKACEIDQSGGDDTWTVGKLLPFCAEAADNEARRLITELRGLDMPILNKYVCEPI